MKILKNIGKVTFIAAALCGAGLLTSCDDYLDVFPKGKKIPKTYADFAPLMCDEYGGHKTPIYEVNYLLNNVQLNKSATTGMNLNAALYMWNESADRVMLNKASESFYYDSYSCISNYNLLIENAPVMTECTDAQRKELVAYNKVLRAYTFYNLVNHYADVYDPKTADATRGVPVIYSADTDAPYKQESVGFIYNLIVNDITESLPSLPDKSPSVLHPDKTVAHAVLAKVYLSMGQYDKALAEAETVLKVKNQLIDWNALYNSNKTNIDNPKNYSRMASPMAHSSVETILFRHGDNSPNYASNEKHIPEARMAEFEEGDNHLKVRWKFYTTGVDNYGAGMLNGYFNKMGIRTVEMYYIKAECLARTGKIADGMKVLNEVRKKHIAPEVYADLTATDLKDALGKIIKSKDNMLIMSLVPFIDMKRLNKEGVLVRDLKKTVDGKEYTLKADSHFWTMVFPAGAVNNPGNGSITQNSK